MFNTKHFDDLARKLFAVLPTSVNNIEKEIQQKFNEILQVAFNRMDLITRDEFDVQTKVLARTREKLEALQQQVDLLMTSKKDSLN